MPLYHTGPGFGDVAISLPDDSSFGIPFTIPFNGVLFNTLYINSNGVISLGSPYETPGISSFPTTSPPLIAPFWIDLNPSVNGTISYRYISNISSIDEGINAFNGFSFPLYRSTSALLITWDEVIRYGRSEIAETFQVILSTNGTSSYAYFLYSDEVYPSGAVVGVNVGDGVNFVEETSRFDSRTIAQGTNNPIFTFKSLYFYNLDNIAGIFYSIYNMHSYLPVFIFKAPSQVGVAVAVAMAVESVLMEISEESNTLWVRRSSMVKETSSLTHPYF